MTCRDKELPDRNDEIVRSQKKVLPQIPPALKTKREGIRFSAKPYCFSN